MTFASRHNEPNTNEQKTSLQNKPRISVFYVLQAWTLENSYKFKNNLRTSIKTCSHDHGLYGAICSIKGTYYFRFYLVQRERRHSYVNVKRLDRKKNIITLRKILPYFQSGISRTNQDTFVIHTRITHTPLSSFQTFA